MISEGSSRSGISCCLMDVLGAIAASGMLVAPPMLSLVRVRKKPIAHTDGLDVYG